MFGILCALTFGRIAAAVVAVVCAYVESLIQNANWPLNTAKRATSSRTKNRNQETQNEQRKKELRREDL